MKSRNGTILTRPPEFMYLQDAPTANIVYQTGRQVVLNNQIGLIHSRYRDTLNKITTYLTKIAIAYSVIGSLMSCLHSDRIDTVVDNKMVQMVFDEREIQDLAKLLDFFESQVCTIYGDSGNLFSCYQNFFVRMDSAGTTGNIDPLIDFDAQQELYMVISDSTFSTIWAFNKTWKLSTPSDTMRSITLNVKGKYIDFLKELAADENLVKMYLASFEDAGDISPHMIAHLLKRYNDYDIHDVRIRLLIAVHYLTLNDGFKRHEKF